MPRSRPNTTFARLAVDQVLASVPAVLQVASGRGQVAASELEFADHVIDVAQLFERP